MSFRNSSKRTAGEEKRNKCLPRSCPSNSVRPPSRRTRHQRLHQLCKRAKILAFPIVCTFDSDCGGYDSILFRLLVCISLLVSSQLALNPHRRGCGMTMGQKTKKTKIPYQSKLIRVGRFAFTLLASISRHSANASEAVTRMDSSGSCTTSTIRCKKSVICMNTEEGAFLANSRMTRHAASRRCHCSALNHYAEKDETRMKEARRSEEGVVRRERREKKCHFDTILEIATRQPCWYFPDVEARLPFRRVS